MTRMRMEPRPADRDVLAETLVALSLDGLLGSARELTREAGALLRAERSAPAAGPPVMRPSRAF